MLIKKLAIDLVPTWNISFAEYVWSDLTCALNSYSTLARCPKIFLCTRFLCWQTLSNAEKNSASRNRCEEHLLSQCNSLFFAPPVYGIFWDQESVSIKLLYRSSTQYPPPPHSSSPPSLSQIVASHECVSRGEICYSCHGRWQCQTFALGVNFSGNQLTLLHN